MRLKIRGQRQLRGKTELPADKSIAHRALMLAALGRGESIIKAYEFGDDNATTAAVLQTLGVSIQSLDSDKRLGWQVQSRGLAGIQSAATDLRLDCGNSGTTIRLLAGLLAGAGCSLELFGDASLNRRPMGRVIEPLVSMGANISGCQSQERLTPPLFLRCSQLHAGQFDCAIASAQVKSCLLLAGLTSGQSVSITQPGHSRDHLERMFNALGICVNTSVTDDGVSIVSLPSSAAVSAMRGFNMIVPGDISAATFLLAAALVVPDSDIDLLQVGINPTRTGIFDVIDMLGLTDLLTMTSCTEVLGEPLANLNIRSVHAMSKTPQPIVIAGALVPRLIDELMAIAALACALGVGLEVHDAAELRVKESDRIEATVALLRAFGANIDARDDGFSLQPSASIHAANVDVAADHRLAMSAAILALAAEGESILDGFEIATVSYPTFVADLSRLGAKVSTF